MNSPFIAPPEQTAEPGTRPRILVVDDSRVMRLAIMKILGTDFEVIQAENGAIAWALLGNDPGIQAVLTDVQMPEMDGYELICRIRAADDMRLRSLPIMTITGSEDDAIKQQAMACGATDFVIKPLDAMQLRARVQAYVRYDQQTRALTERTQSLEEQAITDPQTGLRSRRYLMQRGEQDMAFAQRHAQDLTLLRIDIDGFKKIYRAHGDELVDRLIAWLAKLLFSTARTEDTVARVSGAEFALLATNTGMTQAHSLCERIVNTVASQPFSQGNVSVPVTLTIGVASLGADRCETIEALYALAHQRLCHALSEGGNRICTSILGENPPTVEEVTLLDVDNGVSTESSSSTLAAMPEPETAVLLEIPELVEPSLSSPEIEFSPGENIAEEVPAAVPDLIQPEAVSPLVNGQLPSELMSVDKALAMIVLGKGNMVLPYLESLMREIQPLIDLHHHIQNAKRP